MEKSFIAYIENSIKNNWDLDALTDYKGATLQLSLIHISEPTRPY